MATQAEEKSLSELEREAEHTRADLIHTVDALHSRVSAEAIKAEVKDYARDTGQQVLQTLERKARENPLQAVAIGAGLAYPVWRMLVNIPAPILLVGAGLALSQTGSSFGMGGTRRDTGSRMPGSSNPDGMTDTLKRGMDEVSSRASGAVDAMKDRLASATEDGKSMLASGMQTVSSRMDEMSARATSSIRDTTEQARDMASDAAAAASDAISSTYRSGMETASQAGDQISAAYHSGVDAAGRTADQMTETLKHGRENLLEAIESHPFLIGGFGLLIGAVIASALPVTQTENRLFGDTSDDLKERARGLASEGFETAKSAAQDLYDASVEHAQEHGFTPEGARETVRDVGEKVKGLVQQASDSLHQSSEKPGSISATTT